MNNIISLFDKKKRKLSGNSNDGQDTKKQPEASSLKLSFEKASDGDVFEDSLKSKDCILDIEKMYRKYWKETGWIMYCNEKHKINSDLRWTATGLEPTTT